MTKYRSTVPAPRGSRRLFGHRNRSRLTLETLESRRVLATLIAGQVVHDLAGDGVIDDGDPGQSGVAVYIDANANDLLDTVGEFIEPDDFADGAIISQLMQMIDGYEDGHDGEWIMEPEDLDAASKVFWDAGYQIHVHVNGDLGLEVLLDVLEKRMRESPRPDARTVIVHFANSTDEQIERIARLGAVVSANPYYVTGFANKYSEVGLGERRAQAMVRLGPVEKAGIPFSLHSDLPMAPSDPLYLAWCAVTRSTNSGEPVRPDLGVSIDGAMRAITIDAAQSWRKEQELGSIAPGKIANFTILDEDPYAVDPMKLKDIAIWGTVFEGRKFPVD